MEIKSSSTFHDDFLKNIRLFKKISRSVVKQGFVVYAGNEFLEYNDRKVIPWNQVINALNQ